MSRRGDWMTTFTGGQFWPLDPRPEEVEPRDIAHALAYTCRYNGHSSHYYSVAEHSVLVARVATPGSARYALLHDAAEAYVGDMIRPLKWQIPDFAWFEDRVLRAIFERFDLIVDPLGRPLIPSEVHELDNRILHNEHAALMNDGRDWPADDLDPLPVTIHCWIRSSQRSCSSRPWTG